MVQLDEVDEPRLLPLPPVLPNQAPPSIPLSFLLDSSIQKTYHELTVLSELLPKKTDVERKKSIVQFAFSTRQLFIRLLAIVKWAKGAGKVDACTAISCFLSQQCTLFVETADRLHELAHKTLPAAKLPAFQIPAAVDVLTLGTYPRLPMCIRTHFVPDEAITENEKSSVLTRLNQVIQHRIASTATPLPERMRDVPVRNGCAIFTVPNEFQAMLTLKGELAGTPWTLLKLKFLVNHRRIGEGQELVHQTQLYYIHQLVQSRLNTSNKPIEELFNILHSFAISLQLDILLCQATQLIQNRRSEHLAIDEYVAGERLTISYWRGGSAQKYQIRIRAAYDDASMPLQVHHWPECEGVSVRLPVFRRYDSESLSIEALLAETVCVRTWRALLRLKERIEGLFDEAERPYCYLTESEVEVEEREEKAVREQRAVLVPALVVELLEPSDASERLLLTINAFSGKYLASVTGIERSRDARVFDELETCLNSGTLQKSLADLFFKLKVVLVMKRNRTTVSNLPLRLIDKLPLPPDCYVLNGLSANRLAFKFMKFDNYYLISEWVKRPLMQLSVDQRYYLLATSPLPVQPSSSGTESTSGTCDLIKPRALIMLDAAAVVGGRPAGVKRKHAVSELQNKRAIYPAYYVHDLASIATSCYQRVPFLLLSDELTKRRVKHQAVHRDGCSGAVLLRILSVESAVVHESADAVGSFWSTVLACTVRITHDRSSQNWIFELTIANSPLRSGAETPELGEDEENESGAVQKLRYLMLNTMPVSQDTIGTVVEAFLTQLVSMSHLDAVVRPFSAGFYETTMHRYIDVVSYKLHRLILAYGPRRQHTVTLQYKVAERQFHMSFGSVVSANNERNAPLLGVNPHSLMTAQLVAYFVEKNFDVASLVQVLHDTLEPLAALVKVLRVNVRSFEQATSDNTVLLPITPTHVRVMYRAQFAFDMYFLADGLVAIRDCSPFVANCAEKGRVVNGGGIPGLKAFFSHFGSASTFAEYYSDAVGVDEEQQVEQVENVVLPAESEQQEFQEDEANVLTPSDVAPSPSAPMTGTVTMKRQALSAPCTPASPAKPPASVVSQQTSSPGGYSVSSPPSFIPPSPLAATTTTSGVTPAASTVARSPAGAGGGFCGPPSVTMSFYPAPYTPSPAPASVQSNPMTPSPAPQRTQPPSTVNAMARSPAQTTFAASPQPSPAQVAMTPSGSFLQNAPTPSPAAVYEAVPTPLSVSQTIGGPSDLGFADENSTVNRSTESAGSVSRAEEPFLEFPPSAWAPSSEAFVISQTAFCAGFAQARLAADEASSSAGSESTATRNAWKTLTLFEHYLGCAYLLAKLEKNAQQSESLSEITCMPGAISFKIGLIECKIMLDPRTMTRLRIKLIVAETSDFLSSDECTALERYFSTVVVPNSCYREYHILSFLKLFQFVQQAARQSMIVKIMKSFVNIMLQQMNPDASYPWLIELCMVVPPPHVCLGLASQLSHPTVGNPAFQVNQNKNMLFYLKLTSASGANSVRPIQLVLPLVYDMNPPDVTPQGSGSTIRLYSNVVVQQPLAQQLLYPQLQVEIEKLLKRQSDYAKHSGDCVIWLAVRDLLENLEPTLR